MQLTSQITFLYFQDLEKARWFFDCILKLEVVYDPLWSCVWRTGRDSFLGAVDAGKGALQDQEKGGVLVSLTVNNIEEVYEELCQSYPEGKIGPIHRTEDIGLKSFLFTGPEGYSFEIQEFTTYELHRLF